MPSQVLRNKTRKRVEARPSAPRERALSAVRVASRWLLLLLAGCGPAFVQPRVWIPQGPGPNTNGQTENVGDGEVVGAIQAVAPHPINADILYVGAVNGGIWKTTNAMAPHPTWKPQSDFQRSLSIGALTFDPTDTSHQTLVAGIGRFSSLGGQGGRLAGLLRTTNGGALWTLIDGGGTLSHLNISGVAPRGSTIAISVDDGPQLGIFRSTNTGGLWKQISGGASTGLPAGASFDLASDPKDSKRLFTNAGTKGLYRSLDSGATWTKVSNLAMDGLIATANNIKIAVGTANNVYIAIVEALPEGRGRLSGLFRSGNGGDDWVALDLPATVEDGGVQFGIHPGEQGGTNLSLAADPANSNLVYIGGDRQPAFDEGTANKPVFPNSSGAHDFSGRLFRINAAQPTGSQVTLLTHSKTASNSAPHADSRDMAFAANGELVESDDGGIYRRTAPQTNTGDWFSMNGDIQTTEFHDIAWDARSEIIIGGAQDNGTPQQLLPSNTRWTSVSTGDGGDVAVDDKSTPGLSIRYSSFDGLDRFRRQVYDQANVFQDERYPALTVVGGGKALVGQFITPIEINSIAPTRLVIGGKNSVYESLDQGEAITEIGVGIRVNAESGGHLIAYGAKGNPDVLYLGSGDQVFVRMAASPAALTVSATYPGASSGEFVSGVVVDPADPQTAYVIDREHVYRTKNAGATWNEITGNLNTLNPGDLQSIAYSTRANGGSIIVGGDSGVFIAPRSSGLTTWSQLGAGLPKVPVLDLKLDSAEKILIAGTLGRGAWKLNLPERN